MRAYVQACLRTWQLHALRDLHWVGVAKAREHLPALVSRLECVPVWETTIGLRSDPTQGARDLFVCHVDRRTGSCPT
jgi:hypothetical protein